MIDFNIPPFTGKELEYMKIAVADKKICGDGQFTKKCPYRHYHYPDNACSCRRQCRRCSYC